LTGSLKRKSDSASANDDDGPSPPRLQPIRNHASLLTTNHSEAGNDPRKRVNLKVKKKKDIDLFCCSSYLLPHATRPRCSSPRLLLLPLPHADSVPCAVPGRESSSPSSRGETQRPDAPHRGLRHPGGGGAFPCECLGFVVSDVIDRFTDK